MMGQSPEIERIIHAAASLSEVIALAVPDAGTSGDSELADSRLKRWLAQSGQGKSGKFGRRLTWQGLDRDIAAGILAKRDAVAFAIEPEWAQMLRDLMNFPDGAPVARQAIPECDEHVPFVHALSPLLAFGMETLARRMAFAPLSQNVTESVRHDLTGSLSGVCDLALGEKFERFRRERGWTPGSIPGASELYADFTSRMDAAGWRKLFADWPVLARLVAIRIGHWADDTIEFLERLNQDIRGIEQCFFTGCELPPPLSIECSLSDPHDCGRAVRIVTFEDGRRIVYKPRSLAIDEAWMNLTAWLAAKEDFFCIRAPRAWNLTSHGWAEFIEQSVCADTEGVRSFHRNAGMLICLLFTIRGSDFHRENLIASGEHPIPVDLETLFVPDMKALAAIGSDRSRPFPNTVLDTGLLPHWRAGADGKTAVDTSGLGSLTRDQPPGASDGWTSVNTDAMKYESRVDAPGPSRNLACISGEVADPMEFLPEIAEGFERAYRALIHRRDALLAPDGPIENFRGCPGRIVLRPTRLYGRVLRRSLAPRFLSDGIERSLEFEGLSRPFLIPDERYDGGPIFLAELEALERLDIPRFDSYPELDSLGLGNGARLAAVLDSPALPCVVERIRGLNEGDLELQLELIRSSFATRDLRPETRGKPDSGALPDSDALNDAALPPAVPIGSAALIARARAIGERIARRTVWDGDAASWLGVDFAPGINRCIVQPLGVSLYSGRAGIALFFAALHLVGGGDPEHRRIATGAARSVWQNFWGPGMDADSTATAARSCGIGAGSGLAGIAYALLTCARLLDDRSLIEDAIRVGRLIDEKLIAEDRKLDVISGAAGAIMGLLPLWAASGDQLFLDRAAMCADELVSRQSSDKGNDGGWATFGRRPLAGFSHGAAGTALALTRAWKATGVSRYQDSARRALRYERSIFLPAFDNWPDFRQPESQATGQNPPMASWCNGAPGIGLARLGCLGCAEDELLRDDIETASRWLQSNAPGPLDHVCCGELGKLEILIEGGRRLLRPAWVDAGHRRAGAVITRADTESRGFFSTIGSTRSLFIPGFFNGLSGIAYQMLRLADTSGGLPSVLLWD
jgi:type 2 lantibiotic biosynthesis protein LanM